MGWILALTPFLFLRLVALMMAVSTPTTAIRQSHPTEKKPRPEIAGDRMAVAFSVLNNRLFRPTQPS